LGRNVSQSHTSYILPCIRSLLQALHTPNGYRVSFYVHCTHQRTVQSVICNNKYFQERNNSDVTIKITEYSRIKLIISDHKRENNIRGYQYTKQACLSMDCVCMCFDLTSKLPIRN